MKFLYPLILVMFASGGVMAPAWADMPISAGQCHFVDNYGIYKICTSPHEEREERHHEHIRPIFVAIPQPFIAPVPVVVPQPTPVTTSDDSRRDLAAVDDKLHQLHLRLIGKKDRGEILADFFDEETRYLANIERHEQTDADSNGGYLTVSQETSLLQQLQEVENEINNPS